MGIDINSVSIESVPKLLFISYIISDVILKEIFKDKLHVFSL